MGYLVATFWQVLPPLLIYLKVKGPKHFVACNVVVVQKEAFPEDGADFDVEGRVPILTLDLCKS